MRRNREILLPHYLGLDNTGRRRDALGLLHGNRRKAPFPLYAPQADPPVSGPASLSGLEWWIKGNALLPLLRQDEGVATWADSSGNARDITGVVSLLSRGPIFHPTAGPNGTAAVNLSYLDTPSNATAGGWFTVPNFLTGFAAGDGFAVVKIQVNPPATPGRAAPPFGDWGTAGDGYFTLPANSHIYSDFGSNARKNDITPIAALTSWCLYEERSAAGAWSNHQNGTQLTSTAVNTVAWNTAPLIGRSVVNNKTLNGWIAEMFFYSRILDDATERKPVIHAYLNAKYGFSLATS